MNLVEALKASIRRIGKPVARRSRTAQGGWRRRGVWFRIGIPRRPAKGSEAEEREDVPDDGYNWSRPV